MAKVTMEFETAYDTGDVVLFKDKRGQVVAGVIEGYYIDRQAGDTFWFNIRISKDYVYSYSNGGDIGEHDIICKLYGDESKVVYSTITSH